MTSDRLVNVSERWFRLLERLYPPDFRDQMGDAVVEAYRDRARDALRRGGLLRLALVWMRALADSGRRAGKVKFVGFDSDPRFVEALKNKTMHGIVLQDPVRMGYLAVKAMADHLAGKPIERRIATGEFLATPENMAGPW